MRPTAHARRLSSRAASPRHAVDAVVVGNPVPLRPQKATPRTAFRTLRFDQTQVRFDCAWLADVYPLKRPVQRIEQIV